MTATISATGEPAIAASNMPLLSGELERVSRWPLQTRSLWWAAALLAAFCWSYATTISDLVTEWGHNADYTHGYLVAPLAVLFLWLRRDERPTAAPRGRWLGILLLAAALGLRALAAFFFVKPIEGWSILVWVAGATAVLGGWAWLRFAWPSIAFLFFMIPLPYRMSHWLSGPLQRAATVISSWILQTLGQPALAEGNTILLGDHRLEVEQACSGLRIFIGILAIACAYIMARRRAWWEQLLVAASALPIALLANAVRITVTGLLYQHVSSEAGKQFSHDVSGWVMIPFAALLFSLVLWYFSRLLPDSPIVDVGDLVAQRRV